MRIVFCDSGFSRKEIDYMYEEEFTSCKQSNISNSLISFEDLRRGDIESALKFVNRSETVETGIYRGWMLKPNIYKQLYDGLLMKNMKLINDPAEYKFCHYFPESYSIIKDKTPLSLIYKFENKFEASLIEDELKMFGGKPIIVKDFVKSQKHNWNEACFIPDSSDLDKVQKITSKFIELQDVDFNEGLVFREYVELEKLVNHSASGMPLTKEYRLFVCNGEIFTISNYWDEGDYGLGEPNIEFVRDIIPKIKSNFFTIDIAKRIDDSWSVIEMGDGQVSGLADNINKLNYYRKLKEILDNQM